MKKVVGFIFISFISFFNLIGCLQEEARKSSPTLVSGASFTGIETAISTSETSMKLNWSLGVGVSGFRVYQFSSLGLKSLIGDVPSNQSSFEIDELVTGKTYKFQVKSYDANGVEDTNQITLSALHYPGLNSASAYSVDQVLLNFSAIPSGISKLVLYRDCEGDDATLDTPIEINVGNSSGSVARGATSFVVEGFKAGVSCDVKLEAKNSSSLESANENLMLSIRPYYVMRDFTAIRAYGKSTFAPLQTPREPQVWLTWLGLKSTSNSEIYYVLRSLRNQPIDFNLVKTTEAQMLSAYSDIDNCAKTSTGECDLTKEPATTKRTCKADSSTSCIACIVKTVTSTEGGKNIFSCKDMYVINKERYDYVVVPVKHSTVNGELFVTQPTSPTDDDYDTTTTDISRPLLALPKWTGVYRLGLKSYYSSLTNLNMRLKVAVPDNDMVLTHREAANRSMCALMGQRSDVLNYQTCPYSGPGAKPKYYDAAGTLPVTDLVSGNVYDFGYNLFVDRYEAGGKYSVLSGICGTLSSKKCVVTRPEVDWNLTNIPIGDSNTKVPGNSIIYLADINKMQYNAGQSSFEHTDSSNSYIEFRNHFFICRNSGCEYLLGSSSGTTSNVAVPISHVSPLNPASSYADNLDFQYIKNMYTRSPKFIDSEGNTNPTPPLTGVNSEQAQAICQSISVSGFGDARLPRKRDFMNYALPAVPTEGAWEPMRFSSLSDYSNIYYSSSRTNNPGVNSFSRIEKDNTSDGFFTSDRGCHHFYNEDTVHNNTFRSTADEAPTVNGKRPYIKSAFDDSATSNNFSASGPEKAGVGNFIIGSDGSRNCVSRYGAQDLVGNVAEWASDSLPYDNDTGVKKAVRSGSNLAAFFNWFSSSPAFGYINIEKLFFVDAEKKYRLDEEFSSNYYDIELTTGNSWTLPVSFLKWGFNAAVSYDTNTDERSIFPYVIQDFENACSTPLLVNAYVGCSHNRWAPMLGLSWYSGSLPGATLRVNFGDSGVLLDPTPINSSISNTSNNGSRTLIQFEANSKFERPDFLDQRNPSSSTANEAIPTGRPYKFVPGLIGFDSSYASIDVNSFSSNSGRNPSNYYTYPGGQENYKHILSLSIGESGFSPFSSHIYRSNRPSAAASRGFRCVVSFQE
jgi:hypothetical protein